MDSKMTVYCAAIAVQALLAFGQIGLKVFAGRIGETGWGALRSSSQFVYVGTPAAITGVLYVGVTILWLFVLQNMPVNRAFLFVALSFIFVPLFSHLVLGEVIGLGVIIGSTLIISGIATGIMIK